MTTYTYHYTREILQSPDPWAGSWDIENPNRVDGEGNQIYLEKEIMNYEDEYQVKPFWGKFNTNSYSADYEIIFLFELSPEQKTIIDTFVYNHKHNL